NALKDPPRKQGHGALSLANATAPMLRLATELIKTACACNESFNSQRCGEHVCAVCNQFSKYLHSGSSQTRRYWAKTRFRISRKVLPSLRHRGLEVVERASIRSQERESQLSSSPAPCCRVRAARCTRYRGQCVGLDTPASSRASSAIRGCACQTAR